MDRLKESIERFGGYPNGLLQPVLIDETNTLQDGFCRYTACCELSWLSIPVHVRSKLSDVEYNEIELESNLQRLGFTWQQVVQAVVRIHKLRQRQAILSGQKWTREMTGELLGGYSSQYVDNCINIEPHLEKDTYKTCTGITDAVRLYLRDKEDLLVAEKARRLGLRPCAVPNFAQAGAIVGDDLLDNPLDLLGEPLCVACSGTGTSSKGGPCIACRGTGKPVDTGDEQVIDLSSTLLLGDSVRDLLPKWPEKCVDHIITDPPYGIDVEDLQQTTTALMDVSRVQDAHQVEENIALFKLMFTQFDRVLKPGGFCILFLDIMNWQLLYDEAIKLFRVQRWPIVWHKTSQCKNQCAHFNTTKNIEFAMVCRKENATFPRPVPTSVVMCANDEEKVSNPFAKPFDLWKFCYEAVSIQGQTVLDPFAGEGSGVVAGLCLNRRVIAIEKEKHHYNYLVDNVKERWNRVFTKVRYV